MTTVPPSPAAVRSTNAGSKPFFSGAKDPLPGKSLTPEPNASPSGAAAYSVRTFSRSVKNPSRSVISMNSVLPNTATKVEMVAKFRSI
jgi:hypothetical protein